MITANLLTKYGMDSKGEDIEGLESNDDDEDLLRHAPHVARNGPKAQVRGIHGQSA